MTEPIFFYVWWHGQDTPAGPFFRARKYGITKAQKCQVWKTAQVSKKWSVFWPIFSKTWHIFAKPERILSKPDMIFIFATWAIFFKPDQKKCRKFLFSLKIGQVYKFCVSIFFRSVCKFFELRFIFLLSCVYFLWSVFFWSRNLLGCFPAPGSQWT